MGTELQQHRYDALMRRVGDLKGPGAKVGEVLEEVFPIVDLESPPAELYALGGTALGFGGTAVTAVAAEFSRAQVFNPLGSGKIITVTSALFSVPTTDGIRWGLVNAALLTGVGTEVQRDPRLGFTSAPVGEIRRNTTAAAAPATGQTVLLADTPFTLTDLNGLAVLPEGFGLEASPRTVNIALFATFFWRERVAEPSELNL